MRSSPVHAALMRQSSSRSEAFLPLFLLLLPHHHLPFFILTCERFNLDAFRLDIFDPVSNEEELKKRAAEIRSRGKRLTRLLKRSGRFFFFSPEHHGVRGASERDGGIKSNYLTVQF